VRGETKKENLKKQLVSRLTYHVSRITSKGGSMETLKYESVFRISNKGKIEFNGYRWQELTTDPSLITHHSSHLAIRPKTIKDIAVYYPLAVKLIDEAIGLKDEIAISLPANLYADIDVRSDILTRIWKEAGKKAVAYPSGVLNLLSFEENKLEDGKVLLMDIGHNFVNFSLIDVSNLKPLYMKTLALGLKYLLAKTGKVKIDDALRVLKLSSGEKIVLEYLTYLAYRVRKEIEEAVKEKDDKLTLVGGIKHFADNVENVVDDEFSNVKAIATQSELEAIDFGTAFIKVAKG
jgi:hypothetical protein